MAGSTDLEAIALHLLNTISVKLPRVGRCNNSTNVFEAKMKKKSLKQLRILSVGISSTTKEQVLGFVIDSLKKRCKFFISTPNPEIVLLAQNDKTLLEALNSADLAIADGVGLVWAARALGLGKIQRIPGRIMFEDLLVMANRKHLKVYLLGATKGANEKSILKIKKEYPRIKAKGRSDIFVNKEAYSDNENDIKMHIDILRDINAFKPDILFVALGAPKQEKWIYNNLKNLDIGGAMAVGGTLDTFSGQVKKPPLWASGLGLEWLWRVVHEPSRIRRILNAIIIFPLLVAKNKLMPS